MRDLFQTLADLGAKANQLTYEALNCGGCCVYAALVGEQLDKMDIPVEVVVCNRPGTFNDAMNGPIKHNINETKHLIRQNNKTIADLTNWVDTSNVYFEHVVLRFWQDDVPYLADSRRVTFDLDGEKFYDGLMPIEGSLTVAEALQMARAPGWNHVFDRATIPDLAVLVNDAFGQGLSDLWSNHQIIHPPSLSMYDNTARLKWDNPDPKSIMVRFSDGQACPY